MHKPMPPLPRETRSRPRQAKRQLLPALAVAGLSGLLSGCGMVVMNPSGDVAVQQRNLIVASTALMLLVIVPVIAMTFVFAWRYRASNTEAKYDPDWNHSTQLEVIIWTVPLLIIIALGAMTWISTHTLDPFRPLGRIAPNQPVPADLRPLNVEVVALDWKWLFLYPDYGVASLNEMAAPANVPINFKITSSSVYNTFYVPALAGMIYAMPGMETKLHAVMNKEGAFTGLSGMYSGSGFSRMNFVFRSLDRQGFDEWIAKAKAAGTPLDREAYLDLEKPSEGVPVRYFGTVENGLFDAAVGLCVRPGQMCVHEMHHIDQMGGSTGDSEANRQRLDYDNRRLESGNEASGATFPASGRTPRSPEEPQGVAPRDGSGGGQGTHPPGPGSGPAPAQLSNPPSQPHQH
ncbi:MAG: ubiquinol oxidase subunit II [Microvirga sp.]